MLRQIGLVLLLSILFALLASVIIGSVKLGLAAVYGTFILLGLLSIGFGLLVFVIGRLPVPERYFDPLPGARNARRRDRRGDHRGAGAARHRHPAAGRHAAGLPDRPAAARVEDQHQDGLPQPRAGRAGARRRRCWPSSSASSRSGWSSSSGRASARRSTASSPTRSAITSSSSAPTPGRGRRQSRARWAQAATSRAGNGRGRRSLTHAARHQRHAADRRSSPATIPIARDSRRSVFVRYLSGLQGL